MLHRISLLDELRKGGYEASLITTFNAYLPFYEEVVLRRLVNAGVRHNVLMMDAGQYAHSLATHPPSLAGRNYTLLPVTVGGAFHAKLVFLAGKKKALVLVGSHNMTLAGFGFNRELTNVLKIESAEDGEGVALALAVWAEIDHWLSHFAGDVPERIRNMATRVRDFAPWIAGEHELGGDVQLLAGRPGAQLWDQFAGLVAGEVEKVSVVGAFFDRELRFVEEVSQELKPEEFFVVVDPATVQMPERARTLSDVSLVRADTLGTKEEGASEASSYLHAKGIFVEQKNGDAVFASGSANPSAPAWLLSNGNANVELMLAVRGQRARTTANDIGFNLIPDMPLLNEADWQAIESNEHQETEPAALGYRTGIAIVDEARVTFGRSLLEGVAKPSFALSAVDGTDMGRPSRNRIHGDDAVVEFEDTTLARASVLRVLDEHERLVLKLLLHHAAEIEDHARSGTQRRFKEALLSLETDTPNIELLIQCIDKIVFSEKPGAQTTGLKQSGSEEKQSTDEPEEPESLAIDVEDMKRRKSKARLSLSGDFAYLLDALIYHLRFQEDKSIEDVDRFGRSEEEQVGADDDQDGDQGARRKQEEFLDLCHKRVGTVVNRMIAQLKAYASGKQKLDEALVRLLAVLAVLRELRRYDGRVAWVAKGETTVPKKDRLRLLQAIMFNLFEGGASLLRLESLGEEFRDSDDVARLKGLVLWLAWDCGLTMDLQKPFNESQDDLKKRLERNAMVLALAQMVQSDDVVVDEARQSIGSLTSSEMVWLKQIQILAQQCEAVRQDHSSWQPVEKAEPGDLAIHRTLEHLGLRVVAYKGSSQLSLVKLDSDNPLLKYKSDHFAIARLNEKRSQDGSIPPSN